MHCPTRVASLLHKLMANKYPELFKADKADLDHSGHVPDTTPLMVPPLEFDADVPADLIIRNARLGAGEKASVQHIAVSDPCDTCL